MIPIPKQLDCSEIGNPSYNNQAIVTPMRIELIFTL